MKLTLNVFLILISTAFIQGCDYPVPEEIMNELQQLKIENSNLLLKNDELEKKVNDLEKQINKKRSNLNKMFN